MSTTLKIIGVKEIIDLYGLPRDEVYRLLNIKGCPVLPREPYQTYRVVKSKFDEWLCSRRI